MQYLQKLGKALQFPIVVLPIAALFLRIGVLMSDKTINAELSVGGNLEAIWYIGSIFQQIGNAALGGNLAPLFAIGLGFGMAKDFRGEAALVAFFGWGVLTGLMTVIPVWYYNGTLLADAPIGAKGDFWIGGKMSQLLYVFDLNNGAPGQGYGSKYNINMDAFGGILSGCCVALIYNKYSEVKLPQALAFFSGRRFIPMVTAIYFLGGSFVIAAIWPWLQIALSYMGQGLGAIPPLGAFFHVLFNRLLIPTGLHQVLNTYLWFQQPVTGHLMSADGEALWRVTNGALQWAIYTLDAGGKATITGWSAEGVVTTTNGDINAFLKPFYTDAKFGLAGGSGIFQVGFFPMMMFGLPAAAGAMVLSIKDKTRRAEIAGILGSAAGVSFLTGVTEPIEFAFVFLAPLLFGLHALLGAVFAAITVGFGIRSGFGFSAGFIDYAVSMKTSWDMSTISSTSTGIYKILGNPLMLFPIGLVQAAAYFFSFKYVIKKMNLPTPGREDEAAAIAKELEKTVVKHARKKAKDTSPTSNLATAGVVVGSSITDSKPIVTNSDGGIHRIDIQKDPQGAAKMAAIIYDAIGHDNLVKVDNCMTRLRLTVNDNTKIDQQKIKNTGVAGLVLVSKDKGLQIIVGLNVEAVARELSKISGK